MTTWIWLRANLVTTTIPMTMTIYLRELLVGVHAVSASSRFIRMITTAFATSVGRLIAVMSASVSALVIEFDLG